MANPVRRPAAPPPTQTGGSVNLGDDATYYGGSQFNLPPGRYALECSTQLFTGEKRGEFLAVMVNFHPLDGGDPIAKPLSMGQKAHLSYIPSRDGKGVDLIPNTDGKGITSLSNWGIFRKSLIDCGLLPGYLQNDVTVLNGTWIVTDNQENQERKEMRERKAKEARMGEAAGSAPDSPGFESKSVVCVEILEGGRPWEGTGGFTFPAAPKAGPRAPAHVGPAARTPLQSVPVAAPVEDAADEDLETVTLVGMSEFLEKNPHGCTKLQLRSATFSHVQKKLGDDFAQEAGQTYFSTDAALNGLLAPLGYKVIGPAIKPA